MRNIPCTQGGEGGGVNHSYVCFTHQTKSYQSMILWLHYTVNWQLKLYIFVDNEYYRVSTLYCRHTIQCMCRYGCSVVVCFNCTISLLWSRFLGVTQCYLGLSDIAWHKGNGCTGDLIYFVWSFLGGCLHLSKHYFYVSYIYIKPLKILCYYWLLEPTFSYGRRWWLLANVYTLDTI